MKVLWLVFDFLSAPAKDLGLQAPVFGSWVQNSIDNIMGLRCDVEMSVVCISNYQYDRVVGRVRYISFKDGRKRLYSGRRGRVWFEGRLREVIKSVNPDIIHIHGNEHMGGRLDSSVFCNKPTVISVQGFLNECHIHLLGGISPAEFRPHLMKLRLFLKGDTPYRRQSIWRGIRSRSEKMVLTQHENFIGRTEWDADCLRFYNHQARYFHVDETVRDGFYAARRAPALVRKHSIYCGAAAGYPLKAAHFLIQAIASLKNEFPDIQLRIAAAHEGLKLRRSIVDRLKDDAYNSYLRALILRLGVQDRVIALKTLSEDEVVAELKQAELFVLPSLCENSPNSLAEAMVVGTPSIATYVGGIPSMMKNGIEGVLVQPYDHHALAGAIRRAFLNPLEMGAMAENARQTALKRHDGRRNALETIAVYHKIIGAKNERDEK